MFIFLRIIDKASELFSFPFLVCVGGGGIGQGMFVPAIKGQGTEEQQQKWLPLAYKMQIIGCYAQTELGHGSNVQGLETTATFDPETDEFVIHSPTLTSSKVSKLVIKSLLNFFEID
jgi:alkylation response protein AidB-like acyl-CoA dehydrogenase